ncbi:MAG: putative glycoside hydrolase [Gemmatimonadaceae bacterium]
MRFFALPFLLVVPLFACEHAATKGQAATVAGTNSTASAVAGGASGDTSGHAAATPTPTGSAEVIALQREPRAIRALYVNRFAAQSKNKMRHLIGIADSTEINGMVIDIKDEFGLNWHSSDPALQRNEGGMTKVSDLKGLVDTLRAHGILPIARIVVFKDSVAARMNPEHTIRKADGTPWHDKKGITWVNPYSRSIWDYNLKVAEEAVRMGFGEIQYDYIRFPEPYKSLPAQVFPESEGRSKQDALNQFLSISKQRFDKMGVRTTADIFGLVTTVRGPLEVGQFWEKISPVVDVVLPMVYPSHYPHGSFGIHSPNAEPQKTIFIALSVARQRDQKLGITTPEHIRPWLQAFTLGAPHYGPDEIRAQKQAVYDAGYDGWVLWNPGSKFDEILPALEKTFVSHKKSPPLPMPTGIPLD